MRDKLVIYLFLLFIIAITESQGNCTLKSDVVERGRRLYTFSREFYIFEHYGYIINCTDIVLNSKYKIDNYVENITSAKNTKMIVLQNLTMPLVNTAIFDSFRRVQKLYIIRTQTVDISSYSFAEMVNLTELHINDNGLTALKAGALGGIPKLKILNLSRNKISSLDTINSISSLQVLNLSSNLISNINENDFVQMKSLEVLDLSYNRLSSLQPRVFIHLTELDSLYLRNNTLEMFADGLFAHSITNLDVAFNKLNKIHCDEVTNTIILSYNPLQNICHFSREVTHIDYSQCSLTNIPSDAFKNLDNLASLNLSTNYISEVHVDAFENLRNLTTLSLSFNELTKLHIGTFQHMEILQVLNISWNQIETLELGIFTGLNSLTVLDLSNNMMRSLDYRILFPIKDLEELYLHGNLLISLDTRDITNHLQYLKHISLNFLEIGCDALMYSMHGFRSERVNVIQGNHIKGHNVHGIECNPDIQGNGRKNYEKELFKMISYISTVQTIFILTVVIFIIIFVMKVITMYHKYFNNWRRHIKKDGPSCSLTMLTENDHD